MSEVEPVMPIRERMRRETWLTIRDAAYRLIAERGFDAVSVEDIAAGAGISRATFFNYFPSKLAVIQDPAPGEQEAWLAVFDRPAKEKLWDSLVAIMVDFARVSGDQPEKVRRLYEKSPELHGYSAARTHPFFVDLQGFVAQRTRPGDELDSALMLNIALAVSDTTHLQWKPTVDGPFVEFLTSAFRRLTVRIAPAG